MTQAVTLAHLQIDMQQLQPLLTLWQRDVDTLLQAPPQRLIYVPGEVGGSQHDNMLPLATF
jgi:hypothetical protein